MQEIEERIRCIHSRMGGTDDRAETVNIFPANPRGDVAATDIERKNALFRMVGHRLHRNSGLRKRSRLVWDCYHLYHN